MPCFIGRRSLSSLCQSSDHACFRVSGLCGSRLRRDCPAHSPGPAPVRRSARASPSGPSTRPRIRDGLGRQLVMLGSDGQPAADLLEDLGGIPLPRARRAADRRGGESGPRPGGRHPAGGVERPVPVRREWPLSSGGPWSPTGTGRTGWAISTSAARPWRWSGAPAQCARKASGGPVGILVGTGRGSLGGAGGRVVCAIGRVAVEAGRRRGR